MISRRNFVGGVAFSAYLAACKKRQYWGYGEVDVKGDREIVRAAIHPGIGVARIGNSPMADGFFIGPETVAEGNAKLDETETRDAMGAIKRQAARFRVYGYNAAGEIVKELTADDADIHWEVHLANKKAAWYRFIVALDIPEAVAVSCPRRNAAVTGAARSALEIDDGPREIKGRSAFGRGHRFDGTFMGKPVNLGELRTDERGRLLVLGGLGQSGSPQNKPVFDPKDPDTFNNADGWFDDTSDGPVTARVRIGGEDIPVDPAWVIVAPPNYAPAILGWRTMYDLMVDTFVEAGTLAMPATTSFTRDVLPALRRLSNLQWVNKGFSEGYRRGTENDFEDPARLVELANRTSDASLVLRKKLAETFRPPGTDRRAWPWIYGDAFGTFSDTPRVDLACSSLRTLHLRRWMDGEFVDDYDPKAPGWTKLDDVPLGQQPSMLDRAAMEYCLADAFHPGCELTWPMRHASLYAAPFRIKQRAREASEPDHGAALTAAKAKGAGGPLEAQGPGELTRWMAMPWQGDTVFCRSGYEPEFDPHIPTFWPARVPNHVLTEADYALATDQSLSRELRLEAFRRRESWVRAMRGGPVEQMLQMVTDFGKMGIVEARPGVSDDPDLPAIMFVESLPAFTGPLTAPGPETTSVPPRGTAPTPVTEAGWTDEAQLEAFRRIRIRPPA